MTQTHAQIKLTPKPINLENVISFVSNKDLSICSNSSSSIRQNLAPISSKDIEAQAIVAKMELDAIILYAFEEFNISKVAIHYRLGNHLPSEIAIAYAVSSTVKEEAKKACEAITKKLNGTSEAWKEKKFESGENWIKSN